MARQSFSFENANGERLAGFLHTPVAGPTRAVALFAHCFTCTKNIRAASRIAEALAERGIACLRFDFTGLGESEGDFSATGFSANVADLVAGAGALAQDIGAPELLIGHSLGGTAVLAAAPQIESARAVVTLGAPGNARHVMAHFAESLEEIRTRGRATVNIGGRPFQLSRDFIEDLEGQPDAPSLRDLGRALLVMHSPVDTIVSIDHASELFQSARHPKSFISLDNADHLLSRAADAEYAASVIAAWSERFLAPVPAAATAGEPGVVAAATAGGGFVTEIVAGPHRLLADEPASVGGTNLGPSPYGLLSAALAACTSMTLQMYARRKELPLDLAEVSIEHAKIHAKDCEECETGSGRIDQFRKRIRLTGELTTAQRERMLEIADMCPVHRTLHGEVEVLTTLADSD